MTTIERDDPRLTAYALGELDEAERVAFEAALSNSPEARAELESIREISSLLSEELAKGAPSGMTSEQRTRIEKASGDPHNVASENVASENVASENVASENVAHEHGPKAKVVPLHRVGGPSDNKPSPSRRAIWAAMVAIPAIAAAIGGFYIVSGTERSASQSDRGEMGLKAKGSASPDSKRYAEKAENAPSPPAAAGTAMASAAAANRPSAAATATAASQADPTRARCKVTDPLCNLPQLAENTFVQTSSDKQSTFSIDVDTASYSLLRRTLESGGTVDPSQVRIEEMVNYFSYSYPQPTGDVPFSVSVDTASAPWEPGHRLVRIGLQGKQIDVSKRPAANLVFLLDVSGSMQGPDRIDLLKSSLQLLVEKLDARDKVSIVVYAGASGLVLPPTSGADKDKILGALDRLTAGGSTNGGAGIQLAYAQAKEAFIEGGINRVILATDGDFNVGTTTQDALVNLVAEKAKGGTFLTVLGFGMGNLNDSTLEALADKGNGQYAYVDSLAEAKKVLVEQASGTLLTIAKDVKIQITFDPTQVQSFRLIGYENRVMAHEDFANDKKDAGDIGAGHTVTALYEIVPVRALAKNAHLGDVALRFKLPDGTTSRLVETKMVDGGALFSDASTDFRFATAVAGFGMVLRHSKNCGDLGLREVERMAQGALGDDEDGRRKEFVSLVKRASR
ncbi:MAG: von Willebrand factor type A domain-containing protein [Polyangiaceae bacterium]